MEELKRRLCAEYPTQLDNLRRNGVPPHLAQLGVTRSDAEATIQSNIRACRAEGY